jgi:hypothetical protein
MQLCEMLPGVEAIARLRQLVAALEAGAALPREVAAALAWGLVRYIDHAHAGMTLDAALGLSAPGQQPWWQAERLAARNLAIRRLAAMAPAGSSTAERIRHVRTRVAGYERGGWRRDRHAAEVPLYPDEVKALAWHILRGGGLPKNRRLYEIIGSDDCNRRALPIAR